MKKRNQISLWYRGAFNVLANRDFNDTSRVDSLIYTHYKTTISDKSILSIYNILKDELTNNQQNEENYE